MVHNHNSTFIDLFYALRGGGFGFGVVVSLTVRTHPLPDHLGVMSGSVTSYRKVQFSKHKLLPSLDPVHLLQS